MGHLNMSSMKKEESLIFDGSDSQVSERKNAYTLYNYNMINFFLIINTNLQNSIPKHNFAVGIQCTRLLSLNTKMTRADTLLLIMDEINFKECDYNNEKITETSRLLAAFLKPRSYN